MKNGKNLRHLSKTQKLVTNGNEFDYVVSDFKAPHCDLHSTLTQTTA